jgi:hypothetical protein
VDTSPTTGGNTDSSSNATTNAKDDPASDSTPSPDASADYEKSSSPTGIIVAIVLVLMLILFGLLFIYMRTQKQTEAGAAAAVQIGGNGRQVDNPTYNANVQGGAGVYGGDTNYAPAQDDGTGVYGGDTNYGAGQGTTSTTTRRMTAQLGDRTRTGTDGAGQGTTSTTSRRMTAQLGDRARTGTGTRNTGGGAPVRVVQVYGGGGDAMPYSDAAAGGTAEYIPPPRTHNTGSATYATPLDGPSDDNGQYEEVAQGGRTGTGTRSRVYSDADVAHMANDVQYDAVPSSSNRGNDMVYAVSPNDVSVFFCVDISRFHRFSFWSRDAIGP